jgi:hypothetical protein
MDMKRHMLIYFYFFHIHVSGEGENLSEVGIKWR